MFEIKNLSLVYHLGSQKIFVLKELNLKINSGEFVGIQGPSGSGKSTLFYIFGFLLKASSGSLLFEGTDMSQCSEDELTLLRNKKIGFIFQQFHLLTKTSTLENILLPSRYPNEIKNPTQVDRNKAIDIAQQLGLGAHLEHYPNQLSGGQQQRVAIARALINDVDVILADEPTGNLDSQNAKQILDLLTDLNKQGKTIVLITHDSEVAKQCSKVYYLKDGCFTHNHENFKPVHKSVEKLNKTVFKLPPNYSFSLYKKLAYSVFPLAFANILRNKVKSLLTMLGVVIGIAAVLSMVTLGQFAKNKILETYEALGVNKAVVRGYPNWHMKATDAAPVNFKSFNWERDLVPLKNIFPEIRYMSPSLSNWHIKALSGGLEAGDSKVTGIGINPEYLEITNRSLQAGRNISPFHVENRSPVCLIGYDIAQNLFSHIKALGQIVTLSDGQNTNFPCKVIGVLSKVSSTQEWSPPNLHVMLPYTYFQTVNEWWASQIHEVSLQMYPNTDVVITGKKIKSYFEQKYGKSGMFMVDSDSTLIAQMKKFLNIFSLLLVAIALLSLIVGGIGINNMMLVSVTERIKEFGLRKALGATSRSLRIQILMESVCLCTTAGLLGILLGFSTYEALIYGATKFIPNLKFEWVFEPGAALLSVFSILAVGIASGFMPALKAEKLQVIEALRSE